MRGALRQLVSAGDFHYEGMGTAAVAHLEAISIDRDSSIPLYQQLEAALCSAVAAGKFAPGERLPPIQELAVQLQVSRKTVRHAYQRLAAERILEGTAASGYRACRPKIESARPPIERPVSFDRTPALEHIDFERLRAEDPLRPFCPGFPDTRDFPLKLWETLRAQVLRERAAELLNHRDALGYLPLREAIANRLRGARGVACTADQVIISAGAQQAMHLVVQTLVSPGDAVAMEEPGCYAAKAVFLHGGARVLPLLVDEEGLIPPDARRPQPPVLVYVTPGSQFPLGVKLSAARRTSLFDFARHAGAWILEADGGGEFSYSRQPLPSLQGADESGRVVYLGDLEKMLFPALQLEYLIVPPALVEKFAKSKAVIGALPSAIDQATLERLIRAGHLDDYVRRMNALYYQRLQALASEVDSELSDFIDLEPPEAGLHAVGWLKRGVEEEMVAKCAKAAGVQLPLLSRFGRTALLRPGVVFGFASFREQQLRHAVRKLGRALRAARGPGFLDRLLGRVHNSPTVE